MKQPEFLKRLEVYLIITVALVIFSASGPAIEGMIKSSKTRVCISNLNIISHAKLLWALDHPNSFDVPTISELEYYLNKVKTVPNLVIGALDCPSNEQVGMGQYIIGDIDEPPICIHALKHPKEHPAFIE